MSRVPLWPIPIRWITPFLDPLISGVDQAFGCFSGGEQLEREHYSLRKRARVSDATCEKETPVLPLREKKHQASNQNTH